MNLIPVLAQIGLIVMMLSLLLIALGLGVHVMVSQALLTGGIIVIGLIACIVGAYCLLRHDLKSNIAKLLGR